MRTKFLRLRKKSTLRGKQGALFAAECLLLDETAQQIVQLNDGLVDHIDVVDNGACTGEDAGQLVKDLTHVQECLVSVAVGNGGTAVQLGHLVFVDHGIAGGQFHFGHHNGNSFLS